MKRMDLFVFDVIESVVNDTFEGGQFFGNLENGRVGMTVGSAWADQVPADLLAEIDALAADIIADPTLAVFPRE